MDHLVNLRCLYLGKNMLSEISGLSALTNIETLDLADNCIEAVSGLSCLPNLRTLNLSGNRMKTLDDVSHLTECTSLISLDLASCRLEDNAVVDMLMQMPLNLLRLQGNPVVSTYK